MFHAKSLDFNDASVFRSKTTRRFRSFVYSVAAATTLCSTTFFGFPSVRADDADEPNRSTPVAENEEATFPDAKTAKPTETTPAETLKPKETTVSEKTPLGAKRSFGGIYPHLAWFNNEDECGTGAVVPWADRLWAITYGPHLPNGSSDKLYELDADLNRTVRPESVGGTNANRAIHRESNQLFIGNHVVDVDGNVRTIPHCEMFGRLTAVARHLTDPKKKVYLLTMEEGLYEVDVETLAVKELCRDGNLPRKVEEDVLPGYHGKGGYSSWGRLVYSNNGENSAEARLNPNVPSGCLAEWTPDAGWNVVYRNQFTEVTGKYGISPNADSETAPLWALGWDYRSVILAVLDGGVWSRYRLPKASHAYDGAHGWNTEWPRIREIGNAEEFLATMHGTFWRFPSDFSANNARGIRPRSTYLKVIGDFAFWNGRIAFGCDDAARSEFLNKNPLKGNVAGPGRSNSNLWFVERDRLDSFGPSLGRGAVWFDDDVRRDAPSDAYLFDGYVRRSAFVQFDDAVFPDGTQDAACVKLTFEVDRDGTGAWEPLQTIEIPILGASDRETNARTPNDASNTVPKSGFFWLEFPNDARGEWIRVRSNADLKNATCFFHYKNADERPTVAASIFDGIARPEDAANFLGARLWVRADSERLAVVSDVVENGEIREKRYYELTEDARLERVPCRFEGGESGTISRIEANVEPRPVAPDVFQIDDKSVLVTLDGRRRRLPIGSEAAARAETPLLCRLDRETTTERDLLHCGGTFYELPAQNAGGLAKVRPIATDGRIIADYASYRGMLVLAGIVPTPATDASAETSKKAENARIVCSDDGKCALWLGAVDDLWTFGKAVGTGSVWRETDVEADAPSDPMLATGFDKKTLVLKNRSDFDVEISLEADATANDDWREYRRFTVPAGGKIEFSFPDSFQAYWLRTVADRAAKLSATFIYR